MSKPVINITIGPDGTCEIDPEGFKGSDCKKATQPFEEALGIADGDRSCKVKPEMYQVTTGQKQTVGKKA